MAPRSKANKGKTAKAKPVKTTAPVPTPTSAAAPAAAPAPPKLTDEEKENQKRAALFAIEQEKKERARILASQVNAAAAAGHIIPSDVIYAQEREIQNIGQIPGTTGYLPPIAAAVAPTSEGFTALPEPSATPETTPPPDASKVDMDPKVEPPKNHHMRNLGILLLIATGVVVYFITQPSDTSDALGDQRAAADIAAGDSDKGSAKTSSGGKASWGLIVAALVLFVIAWGLTIYEYKNKGRGGKLGGGGGPSKDTESNLTHRATGPLSFITNMFK